MHRFNFWHFHLFCISQYRKGLPLARGPLRCGAQFRLIGQIGLKPALSVESNVKSSLLCRGNIPLGLWCSYPKILEEVAKQHFRSVDPPPQKKIFSGRSLKKRFWWKKLPPNLTLLWVKIDLTIYINFGPRNIFSG